MRTEGILWLFIALAILVFAGCLQPTPAPVKTPPAVPIIGPDLEPNARKIRDDSAVLAAELRVEQVKTELTAAADDLSVLAVDHHIDVTEQRRQVDAALILFEKFRAEYVELTRRDARQRATIAELEDEAKDNAWLSKVVTLGGMVSVIVLAFVVWLGPVPTWIKPWLLAALAGAGAAGIIGYVLQAYAKVIIRGAIITAGLAIVGVILYVVFNEKLRKRLLSYIGAMGSTIAEQPNAVVLAKETAQKGTSGLGPILDESGCKVKIRK